MSAADPKPENLQTEYTVIGSYIIGMTGARFQTLAIYLAAIGLIVSRGTSSHPEALLMLVLSFGLWVLDLRNRDVLWRLGERGIWIEEKEWGYRSVRGSTKGGAGFFLDSPVPPRLKLLTKNPVTVRIPRSLLTHAFGIDLVFLGVIGYAIALLADVDRWPWVLVTLIPLGVGMAIASLLHRFQQPDASESANHATP